MPDEPISPDREQQRRDNNVSREQSGLEPRTRDREPQREPAAAPRRGAPEKESADENE